MNHILPVPCFVDGFDPHGDEQTRGQHASDLVDFQRIFDHIPHSDRHAVAITLESTKDHISELLQTGVQREHIISLASLMRQSPGGIIPMHFLFGAGATQNRKVAVGMNRNITRFAQEILDKCESEGIQIIETDVPRHDRCSGFIQGLTNFVQLLIGDEDSGVLEHECMKKWKASSSTIFGLMYNNADTELAIIDFFNTLHAHGNNPLSAFKDVVEKNLTHKDIQDFGTPNFERLMNLSQENTGGLTLTDQRIHDVKGHLNSDGEVWLPKEIKRIRSRIKS